jgi:Protein of unknown function (DUF2752)
VSTTSISASANRAWVGPAVVGAAGLAATALIAWRDPAEGGGPFLPCPFHTVTGLWCPMCGATRGVHKLLHGDVLGALGSCAPLAVVLPLAVWAWLAWGSATVGGPALGPPAALPRRLLPVALVALVVFGVARNLPWAPLAALAP